MSSKKRITGAVILAGIALIVGAVAIPGPLGGAAASPLESIMVAAGVVTLLVGLFLAWKWR